MTGLLRGPAVPILLVVGALTGCTQTGQTTAQDMALASEMAIALPDSVAVRPWGADETEPQLAFAATARPNPAQEAAVAALPAASNGPATAGRPADPVVTTLNAASSSVSAAAGYVENAVTPRPFATPEGRSELDGLIEKYAVLYAVPVDLVRAVVRRESNFNPNAYNRGHWGLMQIKHATARGMGYRGSASGLLDAETNLKYAVKYLRGAYLVADGDHRRADRLYQKGYYYDAKRKGLLDETGLGTDRVRRRG